MVQQLLWIEILAKGLGGLVLVVVPGLVGGLLGLAPSVHLWARVLGGNLLGIAAAIVLTAWLQRPNGIGLAGLAAINLAVVVLLAALLAVGADKLPKRGRALLWLAASCLAVLSAFEIVWA